MSYNKVIYNAQVLIDLTEDTVTPSSLLEGVTAHDKSGAPIVGTAPAATYETWRFYLVNGSYIDKLVRIPSRSETWTVSVSDASNVNMSVELG